MLVEQRIRNRIYEHVEAVAGYNSNESGWDLKDAVNDWDMWVPEPFTKTAFPAPAFSQPEVEAIADVHDALKAFVRATPQTFCDERAALSTPEWDALVKVCKRAADTFSARGKLPEDRIVGHEV